MSREQLQALGADVNRLLLAGGAAAAGDEKLRQRVRALRPLGQQVPVLGQIANAAERVCTAGAEHSTRALLDLLVLVLQVRAGLASGFPPDGSLEPLPPSGPWATTGFAHPLHEALLTRGEGFEALKGAVERGVPADLRLVAALCAYPVSGYFQHIADLIVEHVLPQYGRAVMPYLRRRLNLKGADSDRRRLLAICRIDRAKGATLCQAALREGSKVIRVQAVECLPDVLPAEEAAAKRKRPE